MMTKTETVNVDILDMNKINIREDAKIEIVGNAFRIETPDGHYYYNKLETIKAFVKGEIINPRTMKPQKMIRSCRGN